MSKIKCFWLEPTDQVQRSLRRYNFSTPECVCPLRGGHYGHDASADIGQALAAESPRLHEGHPVHGDLWTHDDPRWPTHCGCGYAFGKDDEWQFNPTQLFRRIDTGELMTRDGAPAGAMMHGWWLESFAIHKGTPLILECKLPDGTWWCIDGEANNGTPESPGWTREGDVPNITARPSIATPGYHGWLRDGYLEEC